MQKPIIIPGIDLNGKVLDEEENKIVDELINDQPTVKLSQLNSSKKKLIKLTLLDKDGNEFGRIIGEFDFNEKSFIKFLDEKSNL